MHVFSCVVYHVAERYRPQDKEHNDRIEEGNLGNYSAYRRFRSHIGFDYARFRTRRSAAREPAIHGTYVRRAGELPHRHSTHQYRHGTGPLGAGWFADGVLPDRWTGIEAGTYYRLAVESQGGCGADAVRGRWHDGPAGAIPINAVPVLWFRF